eukprot:g2112.t1
MYLPVVYAGLLYFIDVVSVGRRSKKKVEEKKTNDNSGFSHRGITEKQVIDLINYMPDSVLHGSADRVLWMNTMLKLLWPYLKPYAENVVIKKKALDTHLFYNNKSPIGAPKVVDVKIGSAPVIQGILVVDDMADRLRIEMEGWMTGNSSMTVLYGPCKAVFSNCKMKMKVRIDLGPMLYTAPLFEKVRATILEVKDFDYDVDFPLGNLTHFPFFLRFCQWAQRQVMLRERVLFPHVRVRPLGRTMKREQVLCEGVLEIEILRAKNLRNADRGTGGVSDPFVEVKFGKIIKRTRHVTNSLNPSWHQRLMFLCSVDVPQMCFFHVYDKDIRVHESLGSCSLETSTMLSNQWRYHRNMPLQNVRTGSLTVKARYRRLSSAVHSIANLAEDCAFEIDLVRIHQCKYEHNPWPFYFIIQIHGTKSPSVQTKHWRLTRGETFLSLASKLSIVVDKKGTSKDGHKRNRSAEKFSSSDNHPKSPLTSSNDSTSGSTMNGHYLEIIGIARATVNQLVEDQVFGRVRIPIETILAQESPNFDVQFQSIDSDPAMRFFLPRLSLAIRYFSVATSQ